MNIFAKSLLAFCVGNAIPAFTCFRMINSISSEDLMNEGKGKRVDVSVCEIGFQVVGALVIKYECRWMLMELIIISVTYHTQN